MRRILFPFFCQTRCRGGLAAALLSLCLPWGAAANQAPADAGSGEMADPPALAEPPAGGAAPGRVDPLAALLTLSRYLTPTDMADLSRYMFDVLMDLFRGTQEASLPAELAFKLAVLEQRFKREGDAFMQQVLRDLERDIRRFVAERLPPFLQPPVRKADGR